MTERRRSFPETSDQRVGHGSGTGVSGYAFHHGLGLATSAVHAAGHNREWSNTPSPDRADVVAFTLAR